MAKFLRTVLSFDGYSNEMTSPAHCVQDERIHSTVEQISRETNSNGKNIPRGTSANVELIGLVNQLHNDLVASGHSLDVDLPQIVVVGCQSAGKSSVIESFVGKEFLPRGVGTVTRRPTVIQMYPSEEEFGEFLHRPGERFTNFENIKGEIEAESLRLPGRHGFSRIPINLQIYSPRALKLTVVDLPGSVKVTDEGESEECLEEVHEIILFYASKPGTIILAVSPANHDLKNSDALKIARVCDPDRVRTIGVLTKLDIMDAGTDALEILENKKFPLLRGYVGVMNRSQQDIKNGKDIEYILRKEKEYFKSHPKYGPLAHRMGIPHLQQLLQTILRAHIKQHLPKVRSDLQQKLVKFERELRELKKTIGDDSTGRTFYVMREVQNFIQDLEMKLQGDSAHVSEKILSAGTRINNILFTEVQQNLESVDLVPDKKEITFLIANIDAMRSSISVPRQALEGMCEKLIVKYIPPMELSVQCVANIMEEAVLESAEQLSKHPSIKHEILYRIRSVLAKQIETAQIRLRDHVKAEMSYINLQHPDFDTEGCQPGPNVSGPVRLWQNKVAPDRSTTETQTSSHLEKILLSDESMQSKVKYVTTVVEKYLSIVKKEMGDIVVKYIVYFFVNKVLKFIKNYLAPEIMFSPNFPSLLEDCEQEFRRKEDVQNAIATIKKALVAIQKF